MLKKYKWWPCKHRVIAYTCKYWNISVVSVVFIEIFQHNQHYDTLLPIIPCRHKLKAGIACSHPGIDHSVNNTIVSFRCTLTTVDMDAGVKRHDGEPFKTLKRWFTSIYHFSILIHCQSVPLQWSVLSTAYHCVFILQVESSHKPFTPSVKSSHN
jgi:hypothetical protein